MACIFNYVDETLSPKLIFNAESGKVRRGDIGFCKHLLEFILKSIFPDRVCELGFVESSPALPVLNHDTPSMKHMAYLYVIGWRSYQNDPNMIL